MENNRKIVIKLGGSLLFSQNEEINVEKLKEFCNIVKKDKNFEKIIIVCGGGRIARKYITVMREFTKNEAACDIIGIKLSRINSHLLISFLGDIAYPVVPTLMDEIAIAALTNKIIVMGGLQPGQSTTSVAVEVAEFLNIKDLIILTDVQGIYDKDPKKFPDAKLFKKITSEELSRILFQETGTQQAAAGEYRIFDAVSFQLMKRSHIKVIIMSGQDLSNFKKFWKGEKEFIGTIIEP
ncbi:MAG: UMP kinase [Promethearchaeota archaeon]